MKCAKETVGNTYRQHNYDWGSNDCFFLSVSASINYENSKILIDRFEIVFYQAIKKERVWVLTVLGHT